MKQINPMKKIDVTPTWSAVLPALLAVIQNGKPEAIEIAEAELKRMADAADKYNEMVRKQSQDEETE